MLYAEKRWAVPTLFGSEASDHHIDDNSSSNALASCKSFVSKPSVNQLQISSNICRASVFLFWSTGVKEQSFKAFV